MLAYQVSPSADGEHQTASGQPAMQLYTPISKSDLHCVSLLIAAALSEGETLIHRCTLSEDIHATARVLQALGRSVTFGEDCITVGGKLELDRHVRCCDCGESGSTLRFLVPVLAALGQSAVFTGKGRLPQRPMEPMLTRLREHGVQIALPYRRRDPSAGADRTSSERRFCLCRRYQLAVHHRPAVCPPAATG